jgi:deoxyribodipyrimidine photo-lyase
MSRDQRVRDNWALIYAQKEAIRQKVPLVVLFCFVPHFLAGTLRQYGFMLRGLPQIESDLRKRNIPFFFLSGEPKESIPLFLRRIYASGLFADFSPLRTKRRWLREVSREISIPIFEVDAHNVIPCWKLFYSQVQNMEAFRAKLRSALPMFLSAFPAVRKHPFSFQGKVPRIAWESLLDTLTVDRSVSEIAWTQSGEHYAQKVFRKFLKERIREYKSGKARSDTRAEWSWRLQPYLHFGQISIQRIIWTVMHSEIDARFKASLLEALIARRELADHFCYHNTYYNSVKGFPDWAKKTLDRHRDDVRRQLYSKKTLESAETNDPLWNALQQELVASGRIFGWARKYWAKRFLEWTKTPEEALRLAIELTEKYGINGWDTISYLTLAKAIGGVYDRPNKKTRPVIGQIPYLPLQDKKTKRDFRTYAKKM